MQTIVKNAVLVEDGFARLYIWSDECQSPVGHDWNALAKKFDECLKLTLPKSVGQWEVRMMRNDVGFHFDAEMVRVSL